MLIRDAANADAPAIAALRERTIRTVVAPMGLYAPDEIEAWASNFGADKVAALIAQGNYFVAEREGRVVGIGRLQPAPQAVGYIRGVFADADCIGQGAGTAIVRRLLARAGELGIATLELVATLNARTFYERLGLSCLDRIRHATSNGAMIPGYYMRLVLGG